MSWIFVKQSSVPWTPSNLASLEAWYDADAITGLSDGARIGTWPDTSGNSRDISNVLSTTIWPLYQTNELNGKPVVEFQGNQHLKRDAFVYGLGASTVVWVAKRVGTSTVQYFISEGGSDTVGIYTPASLTSAWDWRAQWRANNFSNGSITTITGSDTWKINFVEDTTTAFNAASNGGAYVQAGTYARSATTLNTFAVGQLYRDTYQYGFNGQCAEILIISGALSATDKQKLEGYLAQKWGLTANLPADHPYKTAAPMA